MKNKKNLSSLEHSLLFETEEINRRSFLPGEKIPKQWIPSWIRFSIKCLTLPFVLIDFFMQKIAKKIIRPPFKREGKCKKRGECCQYILIAYSTSLIGRLFYFWYTQFLGFYKRLPEPRLYKEKMMYVMGCRHLKKNGMCGDYRLRPLICRQWPVIEYFGYPNILKGCGYRSNPSYSTEGETSDELSETTKSCLKVFQ